MTWHTISLRNNNFFLNLEASCTEHTCILVHLCRVGLMGLEPLVQWQSQAHHGPGQVRQVKLISGKLTIFASSPRGPPSLWAPCSGPSCCPLACQKSPIWGSHLSFPSWGKSSPSKEKRVLLSESEDRAWEGGAPFNLLPLWPPS